MKKLIVLFLFVIGLLLETAAKECTVIKIGQKMTIYNFEDLGNSNYWGDKVKITKTDTILPNDAWAKNMGIPDEEWSAFSEKVNGIYDSRVEKLQKNYKKLEGEKSAAEKRIKELELKAKVISPTKSPQAPQKISKSKEISKDYNKLLAKHNKLIKYKNVLEITVVILVLIIILLGLKITNTNFQKKLKSATM